MWIKTQGGYLLNLDNVEYVEYDRETNVTRTTKTDRYGYRVHIISEGNCLDDIANGLNRGYDYMEVR